MFKISTYPRVVQRVPLTIEVDGERQDHSFTATFQVQPMSATELGDEDSQLSFLRAAVVDLADLVDAAEQPVPFSPQLVEQLADRPEVRTALIKAYFEATKKAAEGN